MLELQGLQQQQQKKNANHSFKSSITVDQQEVQIVQTDMGQIASFNQTQPFVVNQTGSSTGTQQKKNRTIQLFMQELFDEKAPLADEVTETTNTGGVFQQSIQIDPSTFYGGTSIAKQSFKNQTINIQKIKEVDQHQQPGTQEGSALEEDMEEGAHFSQTQKIPISLIKQQEKVPSANLPAPAQQIFYNPKQGGPKLNNYISQAQNSSK